MNWKLVLLLALAAGAQANFNAAEGFSGRVADCTSCHATPPLTGDPAHLVLEGLPDTWELDTTYRLNVRVEAGPPARDGLPQGGLDAEFSAGMVAPVDGLTHAYYGRGLTYTVEGAMVRSWSFDWTAPGLATRPAPVDVWVAGMAADGGHLQLVGGDQSEKYDSVDTLHRQVAPSAEAEAAWQALPLLAPTWNDTAAGITGRHEDANATHLAWRTDGDWNRRATGATWRIVPPEAGDLWIRSEGADRVSPDLLIRQGGAPVTDAPTQDTPIPLPLPALLFALLWRRP